MTFFKSGFFKKFTIGSGGLGALKSVFEVSGSLPDEGSGARFDLFASWVMIIGVFLLPLFFLPFPQIPLAFGKTLFLAFIVILTFILWVIARLKSGVFAIPRHTLLFGGLALFLVFLVSSFFAPSFDLSFGGFALDVGTTGSMLILFLFLFLGATLFRAQRQVFYLYGALLLSFGVIFLFHLFRFIFGTDFLSFGVFTSNIASLVGQWNDVGVFAGIVILLSFLALEFASFAKALRIVLYILLTSGLLLLAVINFSLIWILIGIVALAILIYNVTSSQFLGDSSPNGKRFSLKAILIVLLATLFLVFGVSLRTVITDYLGINYVEVRPSWQTTITVIEGTWEENNMLLGSGPNNFTSQWLKFKPDVVNNTVFWNTDFTTGIGLIPTFAVTTGVLGILAWLFFFGVFLYAGFRSLFTSTDPTTRYFLASSFVGSLYLWVVAIFYTPNLVLFGLAFLMTGVFIATLAQLGLTRRLLFFVTRDPRVGFVSVLCLIVFLVAAVLGGYILFEKYLSVSYLYKGRVAFIEEGNSEKAADYIMRATALNDSDNLFRLLADIKIARINAILTQEGASVESVRADFQDALGKAITAGQEAVRVDETNYANWMALGRVYSAVVPLNISGAYENAKRSFEQAATFNPRGPLVYLNLARLELSGGTNAEARTYITKALDLKNNYAEASLLLAQIEINDGNTEGAVRSLEQASLINPNDTSLFFRLGILKYSQEDYKGAIEALLRSVALSPDYSNAKYFLGLSYAYSDNKDEAIKQFEGIEALNPDNSEVKKILENLRDNKDPFAGVASSESSPVRREEAPISE